MKSTFQEATVLITGASSGIGRALAHEVAKKARALVLVARRADRLASLANELKTLHPALLIRVEACDVTDRDAASAVIDRVESELGGVDVLVNNAGVGDFGVFDRASLAKTDQMLNLNVVALTFLVHRVLPGMVSRKRGGIVNISSGFGLSFMPGFAAYVGTKHFVTGFTESLRLDLSGTGVRVTQICPGPVATEFEEKIDNFTGQSTPWWVTISAEHCARVVVSALEKNRALVIPGAVMNVLMWLGSVTPRFVLRAIYAPVARLLRKRQLEAGAKSIRDRASEPNGSGNLLP